MCPHTYPAGIIRLFSYLMRSSFMVCHAYNRELSVSVTIFIYRHLASNPCATECKECGKLISQNSQTFQGKHRQQPRKFQAANTTGNLICLPSVLLARSAKMVISSLRLCSQILDIFKILFHLTRKHDPVPDDSLRTKHCYFMLLVLVLRLIETARAADRAEHLLCK